MSAGAGPLVEAFAAELDRLGVEPGIAVVAVSGGPDSVALLDLLVSTRDRHRMDLVVAHADHGILPGSGAVAERVRRLAERYGLRFELGRLELGADAGETEARERRYAWLAAVRARYGARYVITAHHADDQVETVLMRVLEGSGPAGLAGMAARRRALVRPLLPFRREALARYLHERGLEVWYDPANRDPRHLRSWLRGELLPLLRRRLPRIDRNLERLGRLAAAERRAWDVVLDALGELDWRPEPDGASVAAAVLGGYDCSLARALLMAAGRRVGCRIGPTAAARAVALVRGGVSGSRTDLGGGWILELGFGRARLVEPRRRAPAGAALAGTALAGTAGELGWGRWRLRWRAEPAPPRQPRDGWTAWVIPSGMLEVRGWRAGDRIRPLGGVGSRLLARCFQDARVPRARRAEWPVLTSGATVVWVPGVCRSDALLPTANVEALRIDAESG